MNLVYFIQPLLGKKESIVIQPFNFKIQTWAFSGLSVFLNLNIFIDMLNTKRKLKYSIEQVWVSSVLVQSTEDE